MHFKIELNNTDVVSVSFRKLVADVYFIYTMDNQRETRLSIHTDNYDELYKKYTANTPVTSKADFSLFLQRLLLLLLRYNTVSGDVRGYQMALPESVFAYLQSTYGLQHECFASPMNSCSFIGSFCSRYLDTDAPFGSKGSFFNFTAEEGAYESNPPFVEECMIRNILHIQQLLEVAETNHKALTFFIVVPKWDEPDCESYNRTVYGTAERPEGDSPTKSPFFVTQVAIDKNNHFYRNGMGYQDDFSVMRAQNNSLMLVLQSTTARTECPINADTFFKEVYKHWNIEAPEFTTKMKMPLYNIPKLFGRKSHRRDREDYGYSNKRRR